MRGQQFLEDYTAAVYGAPLYVIVLVVFNAEGNAQRLVVNHRPRSSVLVLSRAMLDRFTGTPLAKHWEGTPSEVRAAVTPHDCHHRGVLVLHPR